MRLQPTVTFEQYRDTLDAIIAAKPKARLRRTWKEYAAVAALCLAVGISLQIPAARISLLTASVTFALLCIFAVPQARRSRDTYLKAVFAEEQTILNHQILSLDATGIACERDEGRATSHHTWDVFVRRFEMPGAYIFQPSPNSFIRVPKAMLTESERELVLAWSSAIPKIDVRG